MSDFYGVNPQQLPSDERFMNVPAATTAITEHADAELGAEAMNAMFGLDKSMVYDTLLADYDVLPALASSDLSVVGINFVDGGITPAQLVAGYNKVAGSKDNPNLYLWPEMYANRSAAWWNNRTPNQQSRMTTAPLFGAYILGATNAPEGLNKTWDKQQKDLAKACNATLSIATEGITPSDVIVADVMALISSTGRLRIDTATFARFVQHERDVRGGSVGYGPSADVRDGQLHLDGNYGDACSRVGFRRLMGPAKKA